MVPNRSSNSRDRAPTRIAPGEEVRKMPLAGIVITYSPASFGKGGAPGTSNSILTQPI